MTLAASAQGWEQHLAQLKLTPDALVPFLKVEAIHSRILLHWDEKLSDASPISKQRNHITVYGYHNVTIDKGCELIIEGLPNEQTHLFIDNLTLSSGASLRLQTDTWVFINRITVLGGANSGADIILKPAKGQSGNHGVNGVEGVSATTSECSGSNGGDATAGTDGSNGHGSRRAFIRIGWLSGCLNFIASAADGGDGGNGGQGGAGGNGMDAIGGTGGNGGHGGHGGHASGGGEMFITIDALHDEARVNQFTPVPVGGKGGLAGIGGKPGIGEPYGQTGLTGTSGNNGMDGQSAAIYLRYPQVFFEDKRRMG